MTPIKYTHFEKRIYYPHEVSQYTYLVYSPKNEKYYDFYFRFYIGKKRYVMFFYKGGKLSTIKCLMNGKSVSLNHVSNDEMDSLFRLSSDILKNIDIHLQELKDKYQDALKNYDPIFFD